MVEKKLYTHQIYISILTSQGEKCPENDNVGLSLLEIRVIRSALKRFPEIEKAVLFGSRAKGNFKPGSDVDIAIEGVAITHECINKLPGILNKESALPYFFDIVHYDIITETKLREHIDRVGKIIYVLN